MATVHAGDSIFSLPLPLYLLVEDVGWWRGADDSAFQQPYRNRFSRDHCLADYEALLAVAKRLGMRIGLGMVLGEWDRTDCLRKVTGATWLGKNWTNAQNRGPRLAEAADYLRENREYLEIGLHGLCHEFWADGVMQRSEFHDQGGIMRPAGIVRQHLDGFAAIMSQNGFGDFPRLFVPPALCHSFGNGRESFQAIVSEYGIRYVITSFARARQYSQPCHPMLTWEEGVILLERGEAPVSWQIPAAVVPGPLSGPVVPLHWANLLHPDPARNLEVAMGWAEALRAAAENPEVILARDVADCFRQAAVYYLAKMRVLGNGVEIDLRGVPSEAALAGTFRLKVRGADRQRWRCLGGTLLGCHEETASIRILEVLPDPHRKIIALYQ